MLKSTFPILALCVLSIAASAHESQPPSAEKLAYNRDIRPILSENCFTCHGPDSAKRKAGLRMDVREIALKGGKSGEPAIVPGKPEASEAIKRALAAADDDDHMPPKNGGGKDLSPAQIAILKRWIAEGAEYQPHWAFIKPERPPVPATPGVDAFAKNPIDNFVFARLAKDGLKPSPEADRATLLRRATLDITGLPPTTEEVDAFIADTSPNAYEKAVDRLFASQRYAERMAVQWLDFARYADSNGFQADSSRQMWPWRDWVINAFNTNEPFDKFTIEQLAGDLLPHPTNAQIVATGFNRNHRLNGEGGRIQQEWFDETVIDRVETTGQTWLALTVGCCRCHDHKFDPITQKEFYQLFAFFNSNNESGVLEGDGKNTRPIITLEAPEQAAEQAKRDAAVKTAEQHLSDAVKLLPKLETEWEKDFAAQMHKDLFAWKQLVPTSVKSEGGATLTKQPDNSWLASGTNPANDTYIVTAPLEPGSFSGVLVEVFPDKSLPNESLGRAPNGNFVLTGVEAEIMPPGGQAETVIFTRADADYEQKGWEVKFIVQDVPKKGKASKNKPGWAVDGNAADKRVPRKALFVAGTPVTVPANSTLTIKLLHEGINNHNVGRFRLSATSLPPTVVKLNGASIPVEIRSAINTDPAKRAPAQRNELMKFFRENTDNPAKLAENEIAAAKKAAEDHKMGLPNTMVFSELPEPKPAFILKRGEYDKPGDKVERGLPKSLPPMPAGAPMNRLGFAQWLVSGDHPLTARVWVNRAWEKYMGVGLVKTTENLGSQSEWPSNPELLDWLATEFVAQKWDMKAMQKLIVMSATYRQSAAVTPEFLERDPDNRLLARGPRFRLTGEILRDQALAVSGLLVEKLGGPSVRPYMPQGVWDETSRYGDLRNYKHETGTGLYRRTLYTFWKRTAAPPTALIFDSPTREICTVKRSRTNTPLQALSLLNEVTYVEAARKLAERMMSEGGATSADRVTWAFRRVTARMPDADELKVLLTGLDQQLSHYKQDPAAASQLVAVGESKPATTLPPAELAAYTVTANVLLNLDEVMTR